MAVPGHAHPHSHTHGAGHAHAHGPADAHDHWHAHAAGDALRLWSVGIDVGSSTTHLTVSQLLVGHPNSVVHRKPEVLERRLVYRSPITFTPFRDDVTIDAAAVARLVAEGYAAAGLAPHEVDTGAVICTGLAALKQNAAAITAQLAAESGRFVCATAGHHFEALLAARGSGSVAQSRRLDGVVANLDVGGGTSKLALVHDGQVLDTAALAVGARLIVTDAMGRVTRIEPGARPLLAAAGVALREGDVLADAAAARVAAVMADCLAAFVGLAPLDPLTTSLLLTDPPHAPVVHAGVDRGGRERRAAGAGAGPQWIVCSGGVSEFVYGWRQEGCGDLGLALGVALRARLPAERLLAPAEGIRATVIGACQYSVQVSGDTVYLADGVRLPLRNVPVVLVPLAWDGLRAETVERAVAHALARADVDGPCALAFRGPRRFGYGSVDALARGLAAALRTRPAGVPLVLAFDQDLANTVGRAVAARAAGRVPLVCVDELTLGDLDYLDIGEPPPGERYLPVVVKSLVFAG